MVHLFLVLIEILKKLITSNYTRITIAISYLIISEGLPSNLAQKKIQEGTGFVKERFQNIYSSQ